MSEKTEIKSDGESNKDVNESAREAMDCMTDLLNSFDTIGCSQLTRENKIKLLKLQMKILTLDIEKAPEVEKEKTKEDIEEQGVKYNTLGDIVKKSLKKDEDVPDSNASYSDLADGRSMKVRLKKLISEKEAPGKQISESEDSDRSYIKKKKGAKKTTRSRSAKEISESEDSEESYIKKKKRAKKTTQPRPKYEEDSDDLSLSDSARKCKRQMKSDPISAEALSTKGYLKIMTERMDNRKVPECEKFDEEAGHDLEEFLDEFEDYCRENVKGDSKHWIQELENQLSGETLNAFKSFKEYKYPYYKLRRKLLLWYDEMEEERKKQYKANFQSIKQNKNESLYIYSTRIERVFKLAYPRKDVERSTTLREKYMDTVSYSFYKVLKSIISYDDYNQKQTKWSAIQRTARKHDRDLKANKERKEADRRDYSEEEEIIINLQQEKPQDKVSRTHYQQNQQTVNNLQNPVYQQSRQSQNSRMGNPRPSGFQQANQFRPRIPTQNYSANRFPQNMNSGNRFQSPRFQTSGSNLSCQFCNKEGHTFDYCRKRQGLCHTCKKPGHISRECNSNQQANQQSESQNYNNEGVANSVAREQQPVN